MQIKKIIFYISRYLVGLLFIFSGTVKAIDPLGTVYKIKDYLEAMSLTQFSDFAIYGAFALFTAEFLAGICLLSNLNFRVGLWLSTLFMVAMTPLTLWIALTDPVSDCGCFGDAIVLTNWQTFWKNIIIDFFVVMMWVFQSFNHQWKMTVLAWIVSIMAIIACVGFGLWTLQNLPVVDFRPYKIGADIRKQMEQPEGTHPDIYEPRFIYSKDGEEKEFTLLDAPYNDTTWTFVDQKSILVEKGVMPPIHDFFIETLDGEDITDEVLDDEYTTYLVVMWNLNETDTSVEILNAINRLYGQAEEENARFIALTASDDITIRNFVDKYYIPYEFCIVDPIQLKTMVRANPGIVTIEKGVVTDKYNATKLLKGQWKEKVKEADFGGRK